MSTPSNSSNSNLFATITSTSPLGPTITNNSVSNRTGQLGLNQRLNQKVKRTYVTPEGARVEETIIIYPPPYHSHEIIRKVVRTDDLLSPTLTGDRMFAPINDGIFQRDSVSYPIPNQNRSNFSISNNRVSYPTTHPIHHSVSQPSPQGWVHNSFQFQNSRDASNHSQSPFINTNHLQHTQPNFSIEELDESADATQSREILKPTPLTAVFVSPEIDDPNALQNQNLGRNNGAKRKRSRDNGAKRKESRDNDAKRKRSQDHGQLIIYDDENGTKYDGKTHSLPHQKYGPYTCPKCKGSFPTSQCFAAHMSSHYKHETREERITRLMAKYSRKYLQFQQLEYAIPITFVPNSLSIVENGNVKIFAQPRTELIVMDEAGSNSKGADNAVPSGDAAINNDADGCFQVAPLREVVNGNGLSDVKVKVESVEHEFQ